MQEFDDRLVQAGIDKFVKGDGIKLELRQKVIFFFNITIKEASLNTCTSFDVFTLILVGRSLK